MAYIKLNQVSVEFPIYSHNSLSIKKNFIRLATGGRIMRDATHRVVVRSLNNISLHIQHGDRVGLIGHNGAGKSTMLRLLAGIYEPTLGSMDSVGKISTMLDIMHGIESESTGFENIEMRGLMLGLSKAEIREKIAEIAEFTELGDYLKMPVRTYSSGMMVRLAFSISTCVQPDILLIDEVFGTGDSNFADKARQKMLELVSNSRIVVFASHAPKLIQEFCNKVMVLDAGQLAYFGPIAEARVLYPKLC